MNLDHKLQNNQQLDNYIEAKVKETLIEALEKQVENLKKGEIQKEITIKDYMSIDRIEGEIAVCELSDGTMLDINKNEFKFNITEGDIIKVELKYEDGKQKGYTILEKDEEEKTRRIQSLKEKMDKIKNRM